MMNTSGPSTDAEAGPVEATPVEAKPTVPASKRAFRICWDIYAMEAAETAILMFIVCFGVAFIQSPLFPVRTAVPNDFLRLLMVSVVMASTVVGITYSPWGRISGAHLNPAISLTFFRLGKMPVHDVVAYIVAQFIGGLTGVLLASPLLGPALSNPPVRYAAMEPNSLGSLPSFFCELGLAFSLMTLILHCTNIPRLAPWTGLFCGLFIIMGNTFESPISGFSINPARWFASAYPAALWNGAWLYLLATPLGMLVAAEVYLLWRGARNIRCVKLNHPESGPCHFCKYHGTPPSFPHPK